jgi:hypothetical protein
MVKRFSVETAIPQPLCQNRLHQLLLRDHLDLSYSLLFSDAVRLRFGGLTLIGSVLLLSSLHPRHYHPRQLERVRNHSRDLRRMRDSFAAQPDSSDNRSRYEHTHGWLKLDPQFKNLINAGNVSEEDGNLVFEIVCKFNVTQADAKASCPSTYHTPVTLPPVGSHVRVVGSYVEETNHAKWMEIHPVSIIEVVQ